MGILIEQPRFGNKSLAEYLISQDCYRYENRERKCSYHDCDDKYELRFLQNAEKLGWEWMRALSSAECIRQAKTERWRNDCFLEWLSFFMIGSYGGTTTILQDIWFDYLIQQERKIRYLVLDKQLFDKKSCDCQTNEFSKIVSSKGNQIEITCKRCPQGTYNLKMGADTCLRCPSHLSPTDTLWNTIGFSEQCWNSTSLKVNDHSESQNHKIAGKETKSENRRPLKLDNIGGSGRFISPLLMKLEKMTINKRRQTKTENWRPLELDLMNGMGKFSPEKFLQSRRMGLHKRRRCSPWTWARFGIHENN